MAAVEGYWDSRKCAFQFHGEKQHGNRAIAGYVDSSDGQMITGLFGRPISVRVTYQGEIMQRSRARRLVI